MPYSPQTWVDGSGGGTPLTAARLTVMETGIEDADTRLTAVESGKIDKSLVDAKGDLIVATAADTVARLAAGTNGHVLTGDSAEASGVKWVAAVPPGVSPGSILNIGPDINGRNGQNHFSLQAARDGDSTTITRSTAQIANGYQESPYFVPNAARTAVQMRVSVGAPVLGSSTSARCELREQDPAGTDYGFDALTGTHVFHGRSKIVSAPDVLPDIVMAQLHNGTVDRVAFRTQLVSGTWRLRLRVNGSSVVTTLGTDMATGQGTIEGTEYEWKIEVASNVLKFYLNDMVTPVYTSGASVFTSTGSSSWYFKAGCYLQTRADGSDGDSLSDYGLVELRDIWHTHPSWATPATFYAVAPHKATHATGGQDALAPSDIGAQPADSDLTDIAGLTPTNDDLLQRKSGAWTNRTPAQVKTDLAITASDITSGVFAAARLPLVPNPPVTLTYAASLTPDAAAGNLRECTMTGDATLNAPTNPTTGQVVALDFLASGAARTLTIDAGITRFAGINASIVIDSGKIVRLIVYRSGLLGPGWVVVAKGGT